MTELTNENEPIENDSGSNDTQELLDQAERERDQFKSIAARAQADLVNYRRRVDDEKSEIRRHAKTGILTKVLSSLDDLDRAMELIPENAAPGWVEGIELVRRNLVNALEAEGVTKILTLGMGYDPMNAEALQYRETEDASEGTVVEVFREGYSYNGQILRAAQVAVARLPQPETEINICEDQEETGDD